MSAPSVALSDQDGQIRGGGAQGWFVGDRRAIAMFELDVVDGAVVPVGSGHDDVAAASFHAVIRQSGASRHDSTLRLRRNRRVSPTTLIERVDITNHGDDIGNLVLLFWIASDFAGVDSVKASRVVSLVRATV
ncbi:MAG: hypothetical protein M3443_11170, partial [Actinomycetota bacterium]|nr:hypothetical protein [Actinomycetota bacterium]